MIRPKKVCTIRTRRNILESLALIAIPYVGPDERTPIVDSATAGRCFHRAVLRCGKDLATSEGLEVIRDLLVDLALPDSFARGFEARVCSEAEIELVFWTLDLLVKVTSYEITPSPASTFMAFIVERPEEVAACARDGVDGVRSQRVLSENSQLSNGEAADDDMLKLSPFLRSLVNLMTEAGHGIDELTVKLLHRVCATLLVCSRVIII